CEEKLGKLASAWQHWKEALDALPPGDGRIAFAKTRVHELEKKLPLLSVTLGAGTGEGARVFRDDVELGSASQGVALPVDPGPQTVTVQLAGHRPESVAFSIGEAEERKLVVRPGPLETEVAAGSAGAGARKIGWIVGGIGVAAVGAAAVTGIMLSSKK